MVYKIISVFFALLLLTGCANERNNPETASGTTAAASSQKTEEASTASASSAETKAAQSTVTTAQTTAVTKTSVKTTAQTDKTTSKPDTTTAPQFICPVTVKITGYNGEIVLDDTTVEADGMEYAVEAVEAALDDAKISYSLTGFGSMRYIASINGTGERDHGGGSGWVFFYNGVYATKGAGGTEIKKNDRFSFYYTLDMGEDVKNIENP